MERIKGIHKVYKVGNHSTFEIFFLNLKGNEVQLSNLDAT